MLCAVYMCESLYGIFKCYARENPQYKRGCACTLSVPNIYDIYHKVHALSVLRLINQF